MRNQILNKIYLFVKLILIGVYYFYLINQLIFYNVLIQVIQFEDGRYFEMDKIVIEKLGEDKLDRYNEVYVLDGINLRKKMEEEVI